ncbi:MAG: (d)CMP kinase [Bacteroidota bacterium]
MSLPITIAIDGFSGCGKSSLARSMAQQLGYRYIDTGAMYRAVTLYFIRHQIDLEDEAAVTQALRNIEINFSTSAGRSVSKKSSPNSPAQNITLLNGEDVEQQIRDREVSQLVSPVATISAVRRDMVAQQRRMGSEGAVVMDGRDIGTVVFPDADLKLFLVADAEVRAHRRLTELQERGLTTTFEEVMANLLERDQIDSSRADSPLRQAEDAIVIDNSELSFEELVATAMGEVERVLVG